MSQTIQRWTCAHCGEQCERVAVRGQRPKWCSERCRSWAKKAKPGRCDQCGSDYVGLGSRFCSITCVGASNVRPRAPKPTTIKRDTRSDIRKACDRGDADALRLALVARSTRVGNCWIWGGRKREQDGYPAMRVGTVPLHRAIVETVHRAKLGSQPAHHACANRSCVNPDRLIPVTHSENAAEMLARNAYLARIRELEDALSIAEPGHPLLTMVRVA